MSSENGSESRRGFLVTATNALLLTVGAVLTFLVGRPTLAPALVRSTETWLDLCPPDRLTEIPQRFELAYQFQQGWFQEERREVVFAFRSAVGETVVFSSHCTHLGCSVRWEPAFEEFQCPCHGGVFNKTGEVLTGPPRRPLNRRKFRIERGLIQVART